MSTISDVQNNELAILSRLLEPESLPVEAARYMLGLTFPQHDRERMNVLAEKARQGTLNASEQAEIDNYSEAGHLLTLLQSKARIALEKHAEYR